MANTILGPQIDIHCGGLDLIFPHHENEIAQCEAHNGVPFANYWVHSGLLTIDGEKMSKSAGRSVTLRAALDKYGAELIKYIVLKHQYRSDINLSDKLFEESLNQCRCLIECLSDIKTVVGDGPEEGPEKEAIASFHDAMSNDFNTPVAVAQLQNLVSIADDCEDQDRKESILQSTLNLAQSIGLMTSYQPKSQIDKWILYHSSNFTNDILDRENLLNQIEERAQKKLGGDYVAADRIRDILFEKGIKLLDDLSGKTDWQFRVHSS